eukprot:TRINITY_DN1317_c0_g1_i1.p1 TRINITY_DN1317_c0_g1~~TRINITY_DN1317_c0_g1_i1.p1  ORF type:complete len:598 (+),score=93.26 TRINITY_DN1317_c0_g1_i1:104-1897(+)
MTTVRHVQQQRQQGTVPTPTGNGPLPRALRAAPAVSHADTTTSSPTQGDEPNGDFMSPEAQQKRLMHQMGCTPETAERWVTAAERNRRLKELLSHRSRDPLEKFDEELSDPATTTCITVASSQPSSLASAAEPFQPHPPPAPGTTGKPRPHTAPREKTATAPGWPATPAPPHPGPQGGHAHGRSGGKLSEAPQHPGSGQWPSENMLNTPPTSGPAVVSSATVRSAGTVPTTGGQISGVGAHSNSDGSPEELDGVDSEPPAVQGDPAGRPQQQQQQQGTTRSEQLPMRGTQPQFDAETLEAAASACAAPPSAQCAAPGSAAAAPPARPQRPSSATLREQAAQLGPEAYVQHVFEYALQVLGMDPETSDAYLIWIARQGLAAPLPPDWLWARSPEGWIYYIHAESKHVQWEHPADAVYREMLQVHRRMLAPVLQQLHQLEQAGWAVFVPGLPSAPPLVPGTFANQSTMLFVHRSMGVDGTVNTGQPIPTRVEELPAELLCRLPFCSTSPGRPRVVDLGMVRRAKGAVTQYWLEVSWNGTFGIVFREHSSVRTVRSAGPAKRTSVGNAAGYRGDMTGGMAGGPGPGPDKPGQADHQAAET